MHRILILLILLIASRVLAQANLIHNGDIELASPQDPPPGWTMWGAQQYKNPAHFRRDTDVFRSGKASLRIHHPPDSAGYIVTSPSHAIRPKRGMTYCITFWAKADAPVRTSLLVQGYESVQPFADAPSPGRFSYEADTTWKQYTFTFREGFDFFATRSRFLMLTLWATQDRAQECTLWIDDVVVTESPNPDDFRMVDEMTLPIPPIEHALRPGDALAFTVDATKILRPATKLACGVSFHRVAGWAGAPFDKEGRYTLPPQLEQAIREMRLPMTRFYGVGHEQFPLEQSLDKVADLCRKIGVPLGTVVLELEEQSASRKLAPADWARAAKYSIDKGYGFRHWEVGNEVYSQHFNSGRPMGQAFPTPDDYIAHVNAVSAAVKAVQPDAQIGLSIWKDNLQWGNYVLAKAAGAYDFVVPHLYSFGQIDRRKFEAVALTDNFKAIQRLERLKALVKACNPGRDVDVLDTEWGLHAGSADGRRADNVARNGNTWGTMHRAVRMIHYVREGSLRGASTWEMFTRPTSPGFGILTPQEPDKRFLIYWLYHQFNRHVGDSVLAIDGTAPWYTPAEKDDPYLRPGEHPGPLTPTVATLSADRTTLHLIIANGSLTRTIDGEITLHNFTPARAEAAILRQNDPEAHPLIDRQANVLSPLRTTLTGQHLRLSLPPHSVTFIKVARASSP